MDFRNVLADETAATIERVLAGRSEESLRQLEHFRNAIDVAIQALELSATSTDPSDNLALTTALVERLSAAAAAKTHDATEVVRLEAEKRIEDLSAQVEDALLAAEEARQRESDTLQVMGQELQEMRATLDQTRAEADSLSERLEGALNERWSLEVALHEARGQLTKVEGQRAVLATQRETNLTHVESLEQAARDAEERRRGAQLKLDAATEREGLLQDRLAGADALVKQMRAEAEAMAQAAAQTERALANAKAQISELMRPRLPEAGPVVTNPASEDFDRLIAIYQGFESGKSVFEVLTLLAKGLSEQFPRTALFQVNGNALQGVYQVGFEIDQDITKIIIPLALDSVLARAVDSGCIETAVAAETPDTSQLPFGEASGWCMAVPVPVNGETVGVIYADDGDHPSPDEAVQASRVSFADVSRRHAVSVLAKLTVDLKELAELRDYATLLLDEVEYIYGADASAGKQNMELVEQLTENLRCAQETYARRASSATAADSASLFEERLNSLIDAKGATSFGRHLSIAAAAIAKREPLGDSVASPRVAQAS